MKAVINQRSWAPDFLRNASHASIIAFGAISFLIVAVFQTVAVIIGRFSVVVGRRCFLCWVSTTSADVSRAEAFLGLPVKHQTRWTLPIGRFSSGATHIPGTAGLARVVIVTILLIPAFVGERSGFLLVVVGSIGGCCIAATPFHIMRVEAGVRDHIEHQTILTPAVGGDSSTATVVVFRASLVWVLIVSIILAIAVKFISRVRQGRRVGWCWFRCGVASAVFNVFRCQTVPRIGVELEGARALTVHWFLAHAAHILRTAVLVRVFVVPISETPAVEFVWSIGVRRRRGRRSLSVVSSTPRNVVWVAALSCRLVEGQSGLAVAKNGLTSHAGNVPLTASLGRVFIVAIRFAVAVIGERR